MVSAVARTKTREVPPEEHFYFVSYVASAEGAPQRIDNGVLGLPYPVETLSNIREMEHIIKERTRALSSQGGQILGDAGVQVRIIDYKRIRRE
jgi:hypothetical protein